MRIVLLTPGAWFPREHVVHVLARILVARGHPVQVVTLRDMEGLCLPVPLPEGATLIPPRDLARVSADADVVWSFARWPGSGAEELQGLRRELGSSCPPIVRHLDRGLEGPASADRLADERKLADAVDHFFVLTEAAGRLYSELLQGVERVRVLPAEMRPVPARTVDREREQHPLYEIDRRWFGSIEEHDVSYDVNAERSNRDALSIARQTAVLLESLGDAAAPGEERPLIYPERAPAPVVEARQEGCRFRGRADDLVLQQMRNGTWEPECLPHFLALAQAYRCEWMLDIGGHVGLYGIVAAKRLGLRVHLFEPQRELFEQCLANCALNGVQDEVQVHELAVSRASAELRMVRDFAVLGRVSDDATASDRIRAVALDEFLADRMPVSGQRIAVKIDVEGHGRAVVEGMRRILRDNLCVLQVEKSPEPVDATLAELGYERTREHGADEWYEPVDPAERQRQELELRDFLRDRLRELASVGGLELLLGARAERRRITQLLDEWGPWLSLLRRREGGGFEKEALATLRRLRRARGLVAPLWLARLRGRARRLLQEPATDR